MSQCLKGVGDDSWNPDLIQLKESSPVGPWAELPCEGESKIPVGNPGARKKKRVTMAGTEREQPASFAHEMCVKWAWEVCGVGEEEFRTWFCRSAALPLKNRGMIGVPACLQEKKNTTVIKHVILLCRVEGLRRAVRDLVGGITVGDAAALLANAEEAFERILKYDEVMFERGRAEVAACLRHTGSFNLAHHNWWGGAWLPGLLLVWLRQEGAQMMGVGKEWSAFVRGDVTTIQNEGEGPAHHFSLDKHSWDGGSARIPSLGARGEVRLPYEWWRLTWHAACTEVKRRHGDTVSIQIDFQCREEARSITWTPAQLYRRLHVVAQGTLLSHTSRYLSRIPHTKSDYNLLQILLRASVKFA